MKKQLRKIVVGEETYYWIVSPVDQNFVSLKIWRSDRRSSPWATVKYRFDDPWLNYGILIQAAATDIAAHFQLTPIRPGTVAEMITTIQQTWVSQGAKTLHFLWYQHGQLSLSAPD